MKEFVRTLIREAKMFWKFAMTKASSNVRSCGMWCLKVNAVGGVRAVDIQPASIYDDLDLPIHQRPIK